MTLVMKNHFLRSKVIEAVETSFCEDDDLRNCIASERLEGVDYYNYFKNCDDEQLNDFYDSLEEEIYAYLYKYQDEIKNKINVRNFVEKFYTIKVQ